MGRNIESTELNLVMSLDDPVFVASLDGTVSELNTAFEQRIGALGESHKITDIWPELQEIWNSAQSASNAGTQLRVDVEANGPDGRHRIFDVRLTLVEDSDVILGISRDVTADRTRENDLSVQATVDQLTGAFNQVQTGVLLSQAIRTSRRQKTTGCFLYLDIDNFKSINDTLGHSAGDQLLVEIVQTLSSNVRESDTIGRLGGDEFGIILNDIDMDSAAKKSTQLAEKLSLLRSSDIAGGIEVSIGIASFPDADKTAKEIIDTADKAMYSAKK